MKIKNLTSFVLLFFSQFTFAMTGGQLIRTSNSTEIQSLHKSLVQITIKNQAGGSNASYCTGVIVGTTKVLMAGHCKGPYLMYVDFVSLGGDVVASILAVPSKTKFIGTPPELEDGIFKFTPSGFEVIKFTPAQSADLAVLTLEHPIPPGFIPAEVDLDSSDSEILKHTLYKLGVGQTESNRASDGVRKVGKSDASKILNGFLLSSSTFSNGRNCGGDSGGPILYFKDKRPVVVGIFNSIFEVDEHGNTKPYTCTGAAQVEAFSLLNKNKSFLQSAILNQDFKVDYEFCRRTLGDRFFDEDRSIVETTCRTSTLSEIGKLNMLRSNAIFYYTTYIKDALPFIQTADDDQFYCVLNNMHRYDLKTSIEYCNRDLH